MLNVTWSDFKQRPVIHCCECDQPVTHRGALVGWPASGGHECSIIHNGCKPAFEAGPRQWVWLDLESFFWLVADELGVMSKAIRAARRKPRRKKRRDMARLKHRQ